MIDYLKHHKISFFVVLIAAVVITYMIVGGQKKMGIDTSSTGQQMTQDQPRQNVMEYMVKPGDSLNSIASQFKVSPESIKWANNMLNDGVEEGTIIRIPPVTGIVHTVVAGDTVESIAAQYSTTPQNILNYPFNEFKNKETHELTPGQTIIVPDGRK